MRNTFSSLVIAIAIALLVPNNGAQAVAGSASFMPVTASTELVTSAELPAPASPKLPAPPASLGWLLAAGFLGVIALRRLRED